VSALLTGSNVTGDGAVTSIVDLGAIASTLILFDVGLDALLTDSRTFSPVATLNVSTDIGVDGGPTGSAQLSSFTIRFTEVPEPATLMPVGAAMVALTLLRRHRRHSRRED
jgi:hypothetical protein